jgi:Yip1 domain
MVAITVLRRPRQVLATAAAGPSVVQGLRAVTLTGAVSAGIDVAATLIGGGGAAGLIISALLPALFVGYWLLDAWLVDAGAGMLGRSGRRRAYLAVSGLAFPPLVAYSLLALLAAAVTRWAGEGPGSALGWLTLAVLAWFLALIILAIRAVYDVPPLNAFALALLPYAAVTAALLVTLVALSLLHAAGVV